MKILLLGGTGAIGTPLVEILNKKNYDIYVTTRNKNNISKGNLTYLYGNAHEMDFIKEILNLNKYDAIVDFMQYTMIDFQNRIEYILNNTKHYIFLSSSRVYDDSIKPITESSPRLLDSCSDKEYINTDEYALLKARQENILEETGMKNYTIIRPYITYNESRLQLGVFEKEEWLYRAINGKSILFSRDIANKYTSLTYGYDTAYIISELICNKKVFQKVIQIANPEKIKWQDILSIYVDIIEKKTNKKVKVYMIDNLVEAGINTYQYKYDRLFNRTFDDENLQKYLNKKYNYTKVNLGIEKCLSTFIEKGYKFKKVNWREEATFDRITQEKTKLSNIPGIKNKIKYIIYRYIPAFSIVIRLLKKIKNT